MVQRFFLYLYIVSCFSDFVLYLKQCLIVMHFKMVLFQARHSVPRNFLFLLYPGKVHPVPVLNIAFQYLLLYPLVFVLPLLSVGSSLQLCLYKENPSPLFNLVCLSLHLYRFLIFPFTMHCKILFATLTL